LAITDRAYVARPDQLAALPPLHDKIPLWITVVGAEGTDAEGFWATIRANPTGAYIQAISQPGSLWEDVGPWLAPLVKAWNAPTEEVTFEDVPAVLNDAGEEIAPARRKVSGIETVPLPPPADGDWTVILKLDPKIREWLLEQVILARFHALGEMGLGKSSNGATNPASGSTSDSTPDGTPDEETAATHKQTSRPARKSSRTP
jgi:hypothetical protein